MGEVTAPLVWLPFEPDVLNDPPSSLRYEVVDPTEHVPDTVDRVRFYVPPYAVGPAGADVAIHRARASRTSAWTTWARRATSAWRPSGLS